MRNKRFLLTLAGFCLVILLSAVLGLLSRSVPAMAPVGGGDAVEGYSLPIIMYHSVLKDKARHSQYVISPDEFEADLKYLRDNGYETVVIADLIDYVENGTPLPAKPVMLTFDDGYYNNYLYVAPLLDTYHMKGVLSIIGYYTDAYTEKPDENAYYSHVTWPQVKELIENGTFELQNHSYNLHSAKGGRKGTMKLKSETLGQYHEFLSADIKQLQDEFREHTGYEPTAFCYPFGAVSNASLDLIRDLGFRASLSCAQKLNHITRDPECLFMLGRYLRPHGTPVSKLLP